MAPKSGEKIVENKSSDGLEVCYNSIMNETRRLIKSRFAGTCKGCGGQIPKGMNVMWSKEGGAFHQACEPDIDPDSVDRGDMDASMRLGF